MTFNYFPKTRRHTSSKGEKIINVGGLSHFTKTLICRLLNSHVDFTYLKNLPV